MQKYIMQKYIILSDCPTILRSESRYLVFFHIAKASNNYSAIQLSMVASLKIIRKLNQKIILLKYYSVLIIFLIIFLQF